MKLNSVYFNMLRAKSEKDNSPDNNNICYHQGCQQSGRFRAPKAAEHKESLPFDKTKIEWLYFCQAHIGTYNRNYDYFATMTPEEVIAFIKADDIGHRPMWRLGARGPKKFTPTTLLDNFYLFRQRQSNRSSGSNGGGRDGRDGGPTARTNTRNQDYALEILGLDGQAQTDEIKARFKTLVKQYHPDLNGGERKYEHRLSAVIESYNELKKSF